MATQIDGLAHITAGTDFHWYNGFKESEWGGDWGPRKCDASTIPPIVARGVLIDVAAFKQVDALPGHTLISTKDLQDTLAWEGVTLAPGDVVLVRTGTARYWGEDGADHARIAAHDSAGPDLAATRWLVEDQGAIMVGSDTSGYEVNPAARLARTPASPSIATCSSSRASTWASSTTSRDSARPGPTRSATSPPSTRSRAPPPASRCGRSRCGDRWTAPGRDRRSRAAIQTIGDKEFRP